jgi:hypothetical protein
MSMNLVGIAGVPPMGMHGKLVGVGCPCAGVGDTLPTPEQANTFRWVAAGLLGAAVIGLWWMESRRHA